MPIILKFGKILLTFDAFICLEIRKIFGRVERSSLCDPRYSRLYRNLWLGWLCAFLPFRSLQFARLHVILMQ